jgi:hypothetical protein
MLETIDDAYLDYSLGTVNDWKYQDILIVEQVRGLARNLN